ncbi:hypothetical protein OS493_040619 [Desmophyllum pertusum]|uniref:Olfactomedin-like domain-containing protein n=1 Tax=Desmophyllum pertusum TaxID=174260 RepID=A0A9W9YH00_9CNID|nr:hypothetical protein OS493_040619 [Desmophyllum pertusum]
MAYFFCTEQMSYMGNAFVACGVIYCIDAYNSRSTTIQLCLFEFTQDRNNNGTPKHTVTNHSYTASQLPWWTYTNHRGLLNVSRANNNINLLFRFTEDPAVQEDIVSPNSLCSVFMFN